jgi:aminopeptidase N
MRSRHRAEIVRRIVGPRHQGLKSAQQQDIIMRTENAPLVRLVDYRPSDFLIDEVLLDVSLDPHRTKVIATLRLRPNPAGEPSAPLVLDGDELHLTALSLDDRALDIDDAAAEGLTVTPQMLRLERPPRRPFRLTLTTQIDPSANTKLMGLYRTGGIYSTQCEADGFRRITYFLDRPDVMSVYTTRIEADRDEAPVLLGNGNLQVEGQVPGTNRQFAVWHDPHPKPAYLFALVGGALSHVAQVYVTASGRAVRLAVHVEEGKQERAHYALDALVRSMRWDERVFGCEYDLDVFNVVAVPDFNMGAMENKGLNIFNDKYVLASPETATDQDYANIEAIIAHEYFHNWTGNRITCRDWFQLCLKEGLTVFRDQEFSSDERSRPVKRIADVRNLRALQFAEDSGPLAHPVRPQAYKEINNFYTPTVYEKGAEVIRMLRTMIGRTAFDAGMALYLKRCDGTAATVEDFLACFAQSSGRDLTQFARWYDQAGTPVVTARGTYDAQARSFRLELSQSTPPTPGQPVKEPVVIPVRIGLVLPDGTEHPLHGVDGGQIMDGVFLLDRERAELTFRAVPQRPVVSLLRDFSAPVRLETDLSDGDLLVLFRHDGDPFNRWQAGQTLATRLMVGAARGEPDDDGAAGFADAVASFLTRAARQDPAFAAQVLMLPSEGDIAREIGRDIDPDAVLAARNWLRAIVGRRLATDLPGLRTDLRLEGPYRPDAASAGRRALRNVALDLLMAGDRQAGTQAARTQFDAADNMTDRFAALAVLALSGDAAREEALDAFATAYAGEPLVIDKWFALQASIPEPATLERVRRLMQHPAFTLGNPNRVRALIGGFALANPTQFNRPDGTGHAFVAEIARQIDERNPQVAARLLGAFKTWRMLETGRREQAEAALRRLASHEGLSRDVRDIVERALA